MSSKLKNVVTFLKITIYRLRWYDWTVKDFCPKSLQGHVLCHEFLQGDYCKDLWREQHTNILPGIPTFESLVLFAVHFASSRSSELSIITVICLSVYAKLRDNTFPRQIRGSEYDWQLLILMVVLWGGSRWTNHNARYYTHFGGPEICSTSNSRSSYLFIFRFSPSHCACFTFIDAIGFRSVVELIFMRA